MTCTIDIYEKAEQGLIARGLQKFTIFNSSRFALIMVLLLGLTCVSLGDEKESQDKKGLHLVTILDILQNGENNFSET
ncbi:MAG: hypothetical protein DRQ41_03520 [Gammaproteobacteria bacterium]|nr:MAG: hypothetical protein DRQ41_03520 [Gammaproteobacteria bacterium]RKZ75800.1 MAG: hypothetical protein DRQ57_06205 [Gammaproteobacteria bacterium]